MIGVGLDRGVDRDDHDMLGMIDHLGEVGERGRLGRWTPVFDSATVVDGFLGATVAEDVLGYFHARGSNRLEEFTPSRRLINHAVGLTSPAILSCSSTD